jgi:hypothetical protein
MSGTPTRVSVVTRNRLDGKIRGVPNQPATKVRGFRIPDEIYLPAKQFAEEDDDVLTDIVKDALERYNRRKRRERARRSEK